MEGYIRESSSESRAPLELSWFARLSQEYSQDYWAGLPVEIACEIISKITDLKSLINHIQVSKTFYRLAHQCIREINSESRTVVPLSYLLQFKNLEVLGDKIIVLLEPDEIGLLSSLPKLREANFLYRDGIERSTGFFLISEINRILQRLNLGKKIPRVNFKIYSMTGVLRSTVIIQGNRFSTWGSVDPSPIIKTLVPNLERVEHPKFYDKEVILSSDFRSFLREGDFGYLAPSSRPSEKNPPLTEVLRPFIESGIAPKIVDTLIFLYARYHNLIDDNEITLDDLMKKYIRQTVLGGNQSSKVDRLRYMSIKDSAELFSYPVEWNFEQFDLPGPSLPEKERKMIEEQVKSIERYYTFRR